MLKLLACALPWFSIGDIEGLASPIRVRSGSHLEDKIILPVHPQRKIGLQIGHLACEGERQVNEGSQTLGDLGIYDCVSTTRNPLLLIYGSLVPGVKIEV